MVDIEKPVFLYYCAQDMLRSFAIKDKEPIKCPSCQEIMIRKHCVGWVKT